MKPMTTNNTGDIDGYDLDALGTIKEALVERIRHVTPAKACEIISIIRHTDRRIEKLEEEMFQAQRAASRDFAEVQRDFFRTGIDR
jgi:hypothetical protein